ncbi:MAG: DarT ssDNA thymidine ADP-ribosyltransferase family protein, partial [Paludibacteraceae bacterium]|nr:DarT ssDNA thymidine ADP-ribosyltransferase family protein [Paludibacteraceae bacterium]
HFDTVKARNHFDLDIDEQPYYQAEILIKEFIPLSSIKNIGNFGIPIPTQPQVLQSKNAYTARIDREHPTAFIFLVDHSASMYRQTYYNGEYISLAEAVARIVNSQINELVERCVKNNETRHYFDIAVIGYGEEAYSAWNGSIAGKDFVTPEEIRNNPFKKITVKEEVRNRKGVTIKDVEKKQWMVARDDGGCTRMDKALQRAVALLEDWMKVHQNKDCYPPTIINITDGEYNGTSDATMIQLSNELKSMFTNDGNALFFNIHVAPEQEEPIVFPSEKDELDGDEYGEKLFAMSSLLPLVYNDQIKQIFNVDLDDDVRYRAMAVNAGMERLVKMMKIGTLSSTLVSNQ